MALVHVRVSVPSKPNLSGVRNRIVKRFVEACEPVHADMQAYLDNFKHKPKARREVIDTGNKVIFKTSTNDRIAGYVNNGTKPHIIVAKRAARLKFSENYTPKTTPDSLNWSGGGSSGKKITARQVMHPGTKARHFTRAIARKHRRNIRAAVAAELESVA